LIGWLRLEGDGEAETLAELKAWRGGALAALELLEQLRKEELVSPSAEERMR